MTEEELSRLFNEIANTAQSAVFSDNNPDVEIKMNPYISYIIECLEGFIYK